jgi:hypothetical protein
VSTPWHAESATLSRVSQVAALKAARQLAALAESYDARLAAIAFPASVHWFAEENAAPRKTLLNAAVLAFRHATNFEVVAWVRLAHA